jgi:GTP-binding protein EngB required for normal cell division
MTEMEKLEERHAVWDAAADDGAARLARLASLAEKVGAQHIAEEARELAVRISEGRFYAACIGQFKRGKSTLINALVGEPILPVGFLPVTTVPTVVRYGKRRMARVRLRGGDWKEVAVSELDQFVSEQLNPGNSKEIAGVEVFVPSSRLSTGMCLVDTPGLGSVFTANTAATRAFIPHIDAALMVLGADPPLSGEELETVEFAARQTRGLVVVLNKADRATDGERAAAADFARRLLENRLGRALGPILEVSAAEQLESGKPQRDWDKLTGSLAELVTASGRQLIHGASERGMERLSQQLLAVLGQEREALERPLEASERRVGDLEKTVSEAQRSMWEMGFLILAEKRRLSNDLAGRHKAFLSTAMPAALEEFRAGLKAEPRRFGPAYRRQRMRQAQAIARRHVLPWLEAEQKEAEKEFRKVNARFAEIGNNFLERLAQAGTPELSRLSGALGAERGISYKSEFTFREMIEIAQPASPLRWLADAALGIAGGRGIIESEAREFLGHILEVNCARVRSDVVNRVRESGRLLELEIGKLLQDVTGVAGRALARARKAQEGGAPGVEAALARLDGLENEIRRVASGIAVTVLQTRETS